MDDIEKENETNGNARNNDNGNELIDGFYGFSLARQASVEEKAKTNRAKEETATEEELKPLNSPEEMAEEAVGDEKKEEEEKYINLEDKKKKVEIKELELNGNALNGEVKKETTPPCSPLWDNPYRNNNSFRDKERMEKNKKEKEQRKPCEDFEQILDIVGGQGKYQKMLLYVVLCPLVTVSPFMVMNMIFMWDVPDHWCHVPGKNASISLEEWKNLTLPWETGPDGLERYSQCKMYDGTGPGENGTENIVECTNGWEYDKTDYSSTIPSDYDWVCDKNYYPTDCFTWNSIGSAVGTVIFGILSDKYGRKPIFFLAVLVNFVFKTLSLFLVENFFIYKLLQLLGGLPFPAVFSMPALISAEISATDYRAWIYAATWMIWVVGNSLIPFVAMICRGWFLFGCVCAVPSFLLFFYYPVVDESPRWLITQNRTDDAMKIILKVADKNGKKVNEKQLEEMVKELANKLEKEKETQSINMWSLFAKKGLAKNTIMLFISWTTNTLLYYGVTLNSTHMAGNKFVNYFLLAIIELPGGWAAGRLVDITGRRWTQATFFVFCTLCCLLCAVAVSFPNSGIVVIIGALGIKFGVTITSLVAYIQGAEIFPTSLRSTGSGLATTVASTIGIFGPYIVYSGMVHVSLPYALLCICSFLGILSSACLPETYKQSLPETLEDANNFGRNHKFWSYLPQAQEKRKNSMAEAGVQQRKGKNSDR